MTLLQVLLLILCFPFFFCSDDDEPANSADVQTRVDISPNITEALLTELSDKNWKNRNEALLKIQGNVPQQAYLFDHVL